MCVACLIGIVRRQPLSFFIARACAPVGAVFTVIGLVTGAFWGAPMWGTWWVWDARLTSMLILLFFYVGYMVLAKALEDNSKSDDLTSIFCLVGSVFAIMSRYAVLFLSTLHQGATLSLDKEENIADVYFWPLIVMIVAFYALFFSLVLNDIRTRIRSRQIQVWEKNI
jgi:heme exporter protein C